MSTDRFVLSCSEVQGDSSTHVGLALQWSHDTESYAIMPYIRYIQDGSGGSWSSDDAERLTVSFRDLGVRISRSTSAPSAPLDVEEAIACLAMCNPKRPAATDLAELVKDFYATMTEVLYSAAFLSQVKSSWPHDSRPVIDAIREAFSSVFEPVFDSIVHCNDKAEREEAGQLASIPREGVSLETTFALNALVSAVQAQRKAEVSGVLAHRTEMRKGPQDFASGWTRGQATGHDTEAHDKWKVLAGAIDRLGLKKDGMPLNIPEIGAFLRG